jgi:hypothetical protein
MPRLALFVEWSDDMRKRSKGARGSPVQGYVELLVGGQASADESRKVDGLHHVTS